MVQRMQGTEAYLQIKTGQANSQVSEDSFGKSLDSDAIRTDTVVISDEGRLASIQMRQQEKNVSTTQPLQEEAAAETEYPIENLSEYTDTELKQMYYRGEITLQEYEEETGEVIE